MNDSSSPHSKPSPIAWFAFRCLARYFVSLFIPLFRHFGETCYRNRGQLFIIKNYGLLTWLFPLSIFNRPFRFVFVEKETEECKWFKMAINGGLNPILLTGELKEDYEFLNNLLEDKEKVILVVSSDNQHEISKKLVSMLKENNVKETLFMALSGAEEVFDKNSSIPNVVPVSMFCGMPFMSEENRDQEYAELNLLEKALYNLKVEETPSIFFNHQRNL